MSSLLPLLCLFVGLLPTLGIAILLARGYRQLAVAQAYNEVSRILGLPVDTRGLSLHGHLDGRRIWVGSVMLGHGTERTHRTWAVLDHPRPLALALLIRRRGLSERLFRRGKKPELKLGADWSKRFEIHGDDFEVIHTLLNEDVKEHLVRLLDRWQDVVITDRSIQVHLGRPLSKPEDLHALVACMRSVGDAMHRSRDSTPTPKQLVPIAQRWHDHSHGLTMHDSWPSLEGQINGHSLSVFCVRKDADFAAELRVKFTEHEPTGFQILPQNGPTGYRLVGQDIEVGDSEFDDLFVVKGWDPICTANRLTEATQELFTELSTFGLITADDQGLEVRALSTDPATLDRAIELATKVASALQW